MQNDFSPLKRLFIILTLMFYLCMVHNAFAQNINEGTEILLTNATSERILGHGLIHNNRLEINVSEDVDEFIMMLLQPDDELEIFMGLVDEEGNLSFTDLEGNVHNFSDFLESVEVELVLNEVAEQTFEDPVQPEDELLEEP